MRLISTVGLERPKLVSAGEAPVLDWLRVVDFVVDPTYHGSIAGKARRNVNRIAKGFSWVYFAPLVVTPAAEGKFIIIDGLQRATAAALVGFERVPCQIVIADRDKQAEAFKAINRSTGPVSRMALHAAAHAAGDDSAVLLAKLCARAEVELLHYPVPVDRQSGGQTMAVGAITQCLKRYGEETLITALQCVTQTTNNRPGILSARMIKALCVVLDADRARRDSGLALLEAFDAIDLAALQRAAAIDAAAKKITPTQALSDSLHAELGRLLPRRVAAEMSDFVSHGSSAGNQLAVKFRGPPTNAARPSPALEALAELARRKNAQRADISNAIVSNPHSRGIRRT
jgi:hypothetical protein